jgi:predicted acyl esterase
MTTDRAFQLSLTGHRAPVDYDRPPTYSGMITEKDVLVPMRDGVKIAADVYRPDTTERLPALLAFSIHNKDLQAHLQQQDRAAQDLSRPRASSHLLLPVIPGA